MAEPATAAGRVLLGVSGSVAAFKVGHLITELRRHGYEVRVAMTAGAQHFITETTLQALSGHPVATSQWPGAVSEGHGMEHLATADWAEVLLIAPASANLLARLAIGLADDAVSTAALASEAPLLLAPAMEAAMWRHPATRANITTLVDRGAVVVGPDNGRLASGRQGEGRMAETSEILSAVSRTMAR